MFVAHGDGGAIDLPSCPLDAIRDLGRDLTNAPLIIGGLDNDVQPVQAQRLAQPLQRIVGDKALEITENTAVHVALVLDGTDHRQLSQRSIRQLDLQDIAGLRAKIRQRLVL